MVDFDVLSAPSFELALATCGSLSPFPSFLVGTEKMPRRKTEVRNLEQGSHAQQSVGRH